MNKEGFNDILEKHKKWLGGEEDEERAELRHADLNGADPSGVNLNGLLIQIADHLVKAGFNSNNASAETKKRIK